jgi:hypothetical protein
LDASGALKNARRDDVMKLLGSPDYSAPDGSYVNYVLRESGPTDRMLYAVVWLEIRFNRDGVVDSHGVRKE